MRKKLLIIISALAAVLLMAGCAQSPAGATAPTGTTANTNPAPVIQDEASNASFVTASATGSINVSPDIVYLSLGVSTQAQTAKEAQIENAGKMDAVITAIKGFDIEDDKIQTTSYYVGPRYSYEKDPAALIGYEVTNMVQVSVLDINKAGEIIDAAIAAGANQSNSIQFSIQNSNEAYCEALEVAFEQARSRAQTMADAAGVTLGALKQMSEGSVSYIPYDTNYIPRAESAASGTSIQSGSLTISATISLTYEIT